MQRWKLVVLVMALIGCVLYTAYLEDPADYEAPSTAAYFTGVVKFKSSIPNVWTVMDVSCERMDTPCRMFSVEDSGLFLGQTVTLAIGAEPRWRKEPNGYVPEHITVVRR